MEKDTIVILEDQTKYALLDDTEVEGKKYFFAVKLDPKTEKPTTEYEVFEEEIEDGEIYMNVLDKSDFKQAILLDFTNNYMNMVCDLMEENGEA